jgi:mannan endo-1,4-beta-mannosidase
MVTIGAAIIVAIAIIVAAARHDQAAAQRSVAAATPKSSALPRQPGSYLGAYAKQSPASYRGLAAFTKATGVRPDLAMYYSSWLEPFQARFAATAARHGAVPLVQIEPYGTSLKAIAAGRYDGYLAGYAAAVRAYGHPVILSFGHEPNGYWYPWSYRHASPAVFVAAWRHIVTYFRGAQARNVTWLWTINIIDPRTGIRAPAPWWPGAGYVTWVGIDGYYYKPTWTFAPLFGPTIKAVRALTTDPIIVSETGAAPAAGKAAKITDLFAGIRAYGLLGFVWFDSVGLKDWRISDPAALAAYHRGARTSHYGSSSHRKPRAMTGASSTRGAS